MTNAIKAPAGRLYVSGHVSKKGYAIERCWSDEEIRQTPVEILDAADKGPKFITDRRKAFRLVERWNRRFASKLALADA